MLTFELYIEFFLEKTFLFIQKNFRLASFPFRSPVSHTVAIYY